MVCPICVTSAIIANAPAIVADVAASTVAAKRIQSQKAIQAVNKRKEEEAKLKAVRVKIEGFPKDDVNDLK